MDRILDTFAGGLVDPTTPGVLHPRIRGEGELWLAQLAAAEGITAAEVAGCLRQWRTYAPNESDDFYPGEHISALITLSFRYIAAPGFMLTIQETLRQVHDVHTWQAAQLLLRRLSFLLAVSARPRQVG